MGREKYERGVGEMKRLGERRIQEKNGKEDGKEERCGRRRLRRQPNEGSQYQHVHIFLLSVLLSIPSIPSIHSKHTTHTTHTHI